MGSVSDSCKANTARKQVGRGIGHSMWRLWTQSRGQPSSTHASQVRLSGFDRIDRRRTRVALTRDLPSRRATRRPRRALGNHPQLPKFPRNTRVFATIFLIYWDLMLHAVLMFRIGSASRQSSKLGRYLCACLAAGSEFQSQLLLPPCRCRLPRKNLHRRVKRPQETRARPATKQVPLREETKVFRAPSW